MSAYNFGDSGRNLTKLYQGTWLVAEVIKWTLILLTTFTTFDLDREYLRNGSTYGKSEKYLIKYISFPIGRKK